MRRARGFTLIELLVAISILAMVAVLGWRGLDGIVRARVALTDQMETTRGMQLAFAQMQSDCEHMADSSALDRRPFLQAEKDRLTLVRQSFVENEPMRLQVVSYRIRDGVLSRRESIGTRDLAQLDVLWAAANSDADRTAPVALQGGVMGMAIETWETGQTQWRAMPAPVIQPTGLQVALAVKGVEAPMVKSFLLGGL
ncbi:prepilin-type N-terminal cleavage/methylation domain-containing protein [Massilia sp. R2A-15]|uniref:PulJ/GspJ family protein n=1 Tax=Massilia sp. R2A-15 TaxID=3064278 RepID=UPI0027368ACA|nr:prepilin-type N-terminal cleavage/methylation domain-containing protein [Massilia sp. R2A-15]WLI89267.1 prepilin-type N-terminal cleavage/methylation domain-containing protein [Massilia sp. R2A-15]